MGTEADFDRSKHVFRSPDFQKIIDEAVKFLCASPVHVLPPTTSFEDAGFYALYYQGAFTAYAKLAEANSESFNQPVYVGKAVPRGWRTSRTTQSGENSFIPGCANMREALVRRKTWLLRISPVDS